MFNNLFKLCSNNKNNIPLEDFNTECFAGILNFYPSILDKFIEFLGLTGSNYKVETQAYYSESSYPTCFIDMVIRNDETICFIENKVNASESGDNQLTKYDDVLQSLDIEGRELRYITKWSDPKKGFKTHFKQFKWYDIASFLIDEEPENPMVIDYYNFLKSHNMALKKEITTDTVIALKNFNQAFQTAKLHLDQALLLFQNSFPKATIKSWKMGSYKSILEGERIDYHIKDLFKSENKYHTEVLIHFRGEDVSYQVQLWMNSKHKYTDTIQAKAKEMGCFDRVHNENGGLIIHNKVKLYQFIDKDNTDGDISKWFENSIQNIKNLIANTKDLDWQEELLS